MKFHRIRLTDYRGIRHCEFEPRESGVTVIEGENEAGKSSIAEALWLVFEQHDDSSSQLVKSLQPIGRDTGTEIEVDVSTGPYRFRYFKRFHKQHRTELTVLAPERETLTGREAHNRARAMLDETIDVALWKALRSQQGVEDSLEPPAAGEHPSLAGAFGEREMAVLKAAEAEFLRYYTQQGRERTGGDAVNLPRLRTAEEAAGAEVSRITARIEELEAKAQRGAELENVLVETAAALLLAEERYAGLAAQDRARSEVSSRAEKLRADLQAREAEARKLAADADYRKKALEGIEPRRAELAAEEAKAAAQAPQLEALRQAFAEASLAADQAATTKVSIQQQAAFADDLVTLSGRQLQAEQMAERLDRLRKREPEIAELERWLADCRVNGKVLAELETLERQVNDLEVRLKAEAATVEITAEQDAEITIMGTVVPLTAGQVRSGKVRGETVMTFPGGITVTLRTGSSARDVEADLRKKRELLTTRLEAAGAVDLAAARSTLQERTVMDERLTQFTAQRTADLRDLGSADELAAKLERERAAIEEILRNAGLQDAPTVDEAKARSVRLQADLAASETLRVAAEQARESARTVHEDGQRQASANAARLESLRHELDRAEQDLSRLTERQPDEELAAALTAAAEARTAAEAALSGALQELGGLEDVTAALREANIEREGLRQAQGSASREEAGIQAVLEAAGADGLHGQLVAARQQLDEASGECAAASRRAAGARLLFETLQRTHDEAREGYSRPLKERIEALGRRVYNGTFEVDLSEDLSVTGRSLNGVKLELSQVSVGGREQLAVLTRLAFAGIASHDGGVPLVLDDVLGWADPGRLAAIGPVLAEAAGANQVLLFTCSPERFASVSPARVIRLPGGQCSERIGPAAGEELETAPPVKPRAAAASVSRPAAPQGAFAMFETDPARGTHEG